MQIQNKVSPRKKITNFFPPRNRERNTIKDFDEILDDQNIKQFQEDARAKSPFHPCLLQGSLESFDILF